MAKTPKGTQDHAKHFQREDHAHAAHQEQAQRDHVQKPDPKVEKGGKKRAQPSHGANATRPPAGTVAPVQAVAR